MLYWQSAMFNKPDLAIIIIAIGVDMVAMATRAFVGSA